MSIEQVPITGRTHGTYRHRRMHGTYVEVLVIGRVLVLTYRVYNVNENGNVNVFWIFELQYEYGISPEYEYINNNNRYWIFNIYSELNTNINIAICYRNLQYSPEYTEYTLAVESDMSINLHVHLDGIWISIKSIYIKIKRGTNHSLILFVIYIYIYIY